MKQGIIYQGIPVLDNVWIGRGRGLSVIIIPLRETAVGIKKSERNR